MQDNDNFLIKIPLNLNYESPINNQKISLTIYVKGGDSFLTFYLKINNSKFSQLKNNYIGNLKIKECFKPSPFFNPIFLELKTSINNKDLLLSNKDKIGKFVLNNNQLNVTLKELNLLGKNFITLVLKYQTNLDLYLPMLMPHQIEKEKPKTILITSFIKKELKSFLNKINIKTEEYEKEEKKQETSNNYEALNSLQTSWIKMGL